MHGLFNYDGFVVQIMNKIADCICLSFLWLLCSLPVFTIGAATTALSYAMNKCVRRSEGGVWKTFWHGFFGNFRQATGLWLLLFFLYGLLGASCFCAWVMGKNGTLPGGMVYFLLAVMVVVSLWACFLFPYVARFQNNTRAVMKNCVDIALMNLPTALLHLVLLVGALAAAVMIPLSILFIPGVYTLLSCYALEPVFRKYMTEEDRTREEAKDQE